MFTDSNQDLQILPVGGYPREVGRLIGILSHIRAETIQELSRVSDDQPEAGGDRISDSIAENLVQIALEERLLQLRLFEGREPEDGEREGWARGLDAGEGDGGGLLHRLIERLGEIRESTLRHLYRVSDGWLDERLDLPDGRTANRYWHLFHLAEEEVRHREHMRWLLGRAAG